MNVYDLYKEDGGKISYNGGNKKHGSCPVCGGKKRFWMNLDLPKSGLAAGMGWFRCGQREGYGCGIKGDAIKYLEQVRNMEFVEACDYLGIDLEANRRQNKYNTKRERYFSPPKKEKEEKQTFIPLRKKWPAQVEHPEIWQEHAEKFVKNCHEALLNRQSCIDYLAGIGITLDLIKEYRIGWHDGTEVKRRNLRYQNSYRPCTSWGMAENKPDQKFVLPAGIVIPSFDDTGVVRIKIRTTGLIENQPKYHVVLGSIKEKRQQDIYNPGCAMVAVVESPFCGRMMAGILKGVTVIILGSANIRPCFSAVQEILNKKLILGCLDTDAKPGRPLWQQAGAAECLGWWSDNVKNFEPLLVPGCTWLVGKKRGNRVKDPGEYYQAGGDIAAWIKWGIAMYTPSSAPKNAVEGGGVASVYSYADEVLAFVLYYPERAELLVNSGLRSEFPEADGVARLLCAVGWDDPGLLLDAIPAEEHDIKDKVVRLLSAGVDSFSFAADADGFLRELLARIGNHEQQVTPINRMIRWMRETGVVIQIGDGGFSLGFRGLDYATEQSRIMSMILFGEFSEKCAHLLHDGVWTADSLITELRGG